MGNHYHALIYIPKAESMSQAEVLRRWQEAELAVNRPVRDDPSKETIEAHRQRIHDISFVVGNFQQRFTQWYNKRNEWRRGGCATTTVTWRYTCNGN